MRFKAKFTAVAFASTLLFVAPSARADPITIVATLSAYIGTTAAVFVANAVILATAYGGYALAAYSVYSSIAARNAAKRQAAAARAAYNAGLTSRNITALTADPAWRVVYGRADTGGDVVAIFTTDKTSTSLGGFRNPSSTVIKADAYKHLIVVWSARQCQAINDIKIDGIPVGALDSSGWATGTEWRKSNPKPTANGQLNGSLRSKTLPSGSTIISVTLISGGESPTFALVPSGGGTYGYTFSGTTLTLPNTVNFGFDYTPGAGDQWDISYSSDDVDGTSSIRIRHHLGAPDQTADAELVALLPAKWTSAHRLQGRCYSWITLDLERAQFQGGPPGMTADISGALVLDPRTGTTAWSQNPALCGYDWLRFIGGLNVSTAEVDAASVIAAANVSDETVSFNVGGTVTTGPRYTCNGPIQIGAAKEAVLLDICEAMAGWASYGGTWRLLAGAWVPPVMDLTDADLHGSIDIVQAGEPSGQLHNAIRGQYVPAGSAVTADLEPYQNATFVAADGQSLWKDLELPFTNSRARGKNIARISVEQSRNGLVIFFPSKMRAWPLQSGDRVRVTSAEYGFTLKTFRVIDWSFGLRSPVGLTLQEDAADAYDEADASLPDPTPNTDLPSPWVVPPLASITAASGTAQLQRLGDGTIISRVLVTWPRSEAAYMQGGRIEIAWREAGKDTITLVNADGLDTQVYLTGVRDGAVIVISGTAINTQRERSAPLLIGHQVVGKSAAPAAITGLAAAVIPGAVRITRTPSTEGDYDYTIYKYGASFAAGTIIPGTSDASGTLWPWPALGSYTVWAADVDTTGNVGAAVSTTVVVDSSIYVPGGSVTPPAGWLNSNIMIGSNGALAGGGGGQVTLPGMGQHSYRIYCFGYQVQLNGTATAASGIYQDGALQYGAYAYAIAVISRATGLVVANTTFNILGGGTASADMAAYLNALDSTKIVAIYTNDEPASNRLNGGLPAAMYRCGASRSVFGSPQFQSRSAYVLIGIVGCGEGNGAEIYQGSVGSDPNAICDVGFTVLNGNLTGVSSTYTPRSLADYSYTGDLAATKNAVTYSATAPASPTDGDLWVDTSGAFAIFKLRSGGAWVTGANALSAYNALSGTPVSLADINTTESTKLGGIAANATRNITYRQSGDPVISPGGVVDGATWQDTSTGKTYERVGSTWQPYVGSGSVNTGEIAANAITTQPVGTYAGPVSAVGLTEVARLNFGPFAVDTRIVVAFVGQVHATSVPPSGPPFITVDNYLEDSVAGAGATVRSYAGGVATIDVSVYLIRTVDLTAGTSGWVRAMGNVTTLSTGEYKNMTLVASVYKR